MAMTGIQSLDASVHKVNEWVNQVGEELGGVDKQAAYSALCAGLQLLRDRLTVERSTHLAAQLPLVLKGAFFEEWQPARVPQRIRHRDEYLEALDEQLPGSLKGRAEDVAKAVMHTVSTHVTRGEVEKVRSSLPVEIRELWSDVN